jgi:hypothetical protein
MLFSTYVCMYVYMCVCMYLCVYICMCICMCVYVYVCICMCVYMYVFIYVCVCVWCRISRISLILSSYCQQMSLSTRVSFLIYFQLCCE